MCTAVLYNKSITVCAPFQPALDYKGLTQLSPIACRIRSLIPPCECVLLKFLVPLFFLLACTNTGTSRYATFDSWKESCYPNSFLLGEFNIYVRNICLRTTWIDMQSFQNLCQFYSCNARTCFATRNLVVLLTFKLENSELFYSFILNL